MNEKELNETRDSILIFIGKIILDMKDKLDETREVLRMVYKEEPEIYHSYWGDRDTDMLSSSINDMKRHYEEMNEDK